MNTSHCPEASWRSYTRLFYPWSEAQKVIKRSTLPEQEKESASTSACPGQADYRTTATGPNEEGVTNGHDNANSHQIQAFGFNSVGLHQRSRSANAAAYRPRCEDNLLKPSPLLASVCGHSQIPLYASGNSEDYPEFYTWYRADSAARMSRSSYGAAGPAHAQYARRPSRMPPSMSGVYTQIEAQSPVSQRRPLSSSSAASSVRSNDTFDAILASPTSSKTSFDSWQSVSRSSGGYQRPAPIKQYRRRREPGELFAALPVEVVGLILQKLRDSHLVPGSSSCATCMMRDLCSVAISAKKLLKVARVALYEHIELVGADSPHVQKKRFKAGFGARLTLLRRTLRAQPTIAILVRYLKAPAVPPGVALEAYQNLVASVVMACPNLEILAGPHLNFDFSFNRLSHALSTREQLREMHWTLAPSPTPQNKARITNGANSGNPNNQETPDDLRQKQSDWFRELHMDWSNLTTLSIHCLPGSMLASSSLLSDIITEIPSLQHLYLSRLPPMVFNDANLLSLPALNTLTLSHLPGVSSRGLCSFARRPWNQSIRKLTLQHLKIDSLPTIAQILSYLISLESFAFVQPHAPLLPEGETIWLFPYLASGTLRKLHWDIPSPTATASSADIMLAKSIAARGFPSLRRLRTPADPEGIFQALCKPLEGIDNTSEQQRGLITKAGSTSSPAANVAPADEPPRPSTNLVISRIEAQKRIEAARTQPRFTLTVVDEAGRICETQRIAGFMGEVGSKIEYVVEADEGAGDENGGLRDIGDFLGDGGESLRDANHEGCTGRWNTHDGAVVDKKDRERWWHVERGRWQRVEF
ncbi:hypothetical protein GGS21DRAFT_539225 [Xylaria nigripes]|nr:hypothetical protein GGS21DRAFT_539225 [Xylaria nigripes]